MGKQKKQDTIGIKDAFPKHLRNKAKNGEITDTDWSEFKGILHNLDKSGKHLDKKAKRFVTTFSDQAEKSPDVSAWHKAHDLLLKAAAQRAIGY